ncbi:tRNA:m(4)X modification enzyme TRM13-like [Oopsacas minuta]|uniref:tRNA:m(4)X modification enzyme TRM13 n=1 Tax=Oopsacas minuta TaxID=111878 RepID=A0AAV7JAM6_9METZ|nr:tRNA:m(4)X modification enzyme TRM13-like [Oopsacas minuta]
MATNSVDLKSELTSANSIVTEDTALTEKPSTVKCQYYLPQKKRMCRMLAIHNAQFCGLHLALSGGDINLDYKRIPCPLDPKHTVYPANLDKHILKCNARPKPHPIYYVDGVNSGLTGTVPCPEDTCNLAAFPEDYILKLIHRVEIAYESFVKSINDCYITHLSMKAELTDSKNGETARKHLLQQASIIGYIHKTLTCYTDVTFIEFGAGRGKLSHWVQRSLPESAVNPEFIVVDRAACRYKYDSYHKSDGPIFHRLFIDIEHLYLSKVDGITPERSIVGYCKHLCGAATDLALSCLMNTLSAPKRPIIVMATCCHHQCTWPAYVGRKFFEMQLKFNSIDFHAISLLSSWKVCGMKQDSNSEILNCDPSLLSLRDLPAPYKEDIGYKCKRLIDMGRVWWLRENGMNTDILAYVPQNVTVENIVIIATPNI